MSRRKVAAVRVKRAAKQPAESAPKPVTVPISEQQVKVLSAMLAEVKAAEERLNLVLTGVLSGHGYGPANVLSMDTDARTLTFVPQQ